MSEVLIFAGTTEGRELACLLSASKIECDVCVAGGYGSSLLEESGFLHIHEGRLEEEGMRLLYKKTGAKIVVDATHPYASRVTETIINSIKESEITYIRLLRPSEKKESYAEYESSADCAAALLETDGKILLTTGSKELSEFCREKKLRRRLVVRVLPAYESIRLCYDNRLEGNQIIAMQGPFSAKMNEALIRQYGIKQLVTKDSGTIGGVDTKLLAATATDTAVHIIKRPEDKSGKGLSFSETVARLEKLLNAAIKTAEIRVTLAGAGCGSPGNMTEEVKTEIYSSDYVFAAKRILDSIKTRAKTYPYYLAKDIIPVIRKLRDEHAQGFKVTILFSGDTGFYSGCEKMYEELRGEDYIDLRILPGISSVSMLSAKTNISWQDACIVSAHGVDDIKWKAELMKKVPFNKKTFFITSGVGDVNSIFSLLTENNLGNVEIKLGYRLSYEDEKIYSLKVSEYQPLSEEGLYTGVIINENPVSGLVVPSIGDNEFIREDVPMTKEEVRSLSVCKLKLKNKSVVYDIGSGTGSIAIQSAAMSQDIKVYAIERSHEAVELINKNIKKLAVNNISVIESEAPDKLKELPPADCAFIGGSGGRLCDILKALYEINPAMRIVLNAISLESISGMNEALKSFAHEELDIIQVSINKVNRIGDYSMIKANNPVFIYSFKFKRS